MTKRNLELINSDLCISVTCTVMIYVLTATHHSIHGSPQSCRVRIRELEFSSRYINNLSAWYFCVLSVFALIEWQWATPWLMSIFAQNSPDGRFSNNAYWSAPQFHSSNVVFDKFMRVLEDDIALINASLVSSMFLKCAGIIIIVTCKVEFIKSDRWPVCIH